MAIIVGTNSYLTLDEFKAWADLRNNDYSSFSDTQIEAALVVSSLDFIDPNFNFKGQLIDELQPMKLPTNTVSIANVSGGASQAAWQQLNNELFLSIAASGLGQVTKQMDKLDVLETETEYAEGSAPSYSYDTTQISRMLAPYITSKVGGNMGRVRKC